MGPLRSLPLADVLLVARDGERGTAARTYPPALRRFLINRIAERAGPGGLADARRELAARARATGAYAVAVQVLLEGDLTAEAVELADREVEALRNANRLDEARRVVRLLPAASLTEHPHLQELAAWPLLEEPLDVSAPAGWRVNRRLLGAVLSLILLVGLWALPPPEGLSVRGWHAVLMLVAVLPLLVLEVLPDGIIALLLAAGWIVGGVTTPAIALGGFATTNWVLVVTALAVGSGDCIVRAAVPHGAVDRRQQPGRIRRTRKRAGRGRFTGWPGGAERHQPRDPGCASRERARRRRRLRAAQSASVGLSMAVLMGFGQMVAMFLTSSSTAVLVYAVLPESTRADLTWISWAAQALPTHVLLLGGLLAFVVWRYRPEHETTNTERAQRALALQRALLGRLSRHEQIALVVTVLMLIGFATQPLHGIDPAWVGVLALACLAATGVLASNGLSSVNWSFALLSGILTSMSVVFADTGLDVWLAGLATQALGGMSNSPVVFVAVLCVVCFGG